VIIHKGDTDLAYKISPMYRESHVELSSNIGITARGEDVPGQAAEPQREHISLPGEPLGAIDEDIRLTENGTPAYDPSTHTLGPLCVKGHDYDGSGHSLRRGKDCLECARERQQKYRQRQAQRG
jgi:hypothetical protein